MIMDSIEAYAVDSIPVIEYEECLSERKWWCFLLSSIFTFILGLISVVIVRFLQNFFFKKEDNGDTEEEKQAKKEEAKKMRLQGQNPDGDEAKDWAGELISAQNGLGKILVVMVFVLSISS